MMTNLLVETLNVLKEHNLTKNDVKWVQDEDNSITWEKFSELANFKYDAGFGREEINLSLVVLGSNWWLERHEYDGSEWWEYKKLPTVKEIAESIRIK